VTRVRDRYPHGRRRFAAPGACARLELARSPCERERPYTLKTQNCDPIYRASVEYLLRRFGALKDDVSMARWNDELRTTLINLINSTSRAEVVTASDNRIDFRSSAPLRTFWVICEDAGFKVKDTTGVQSRVGVQPTPHGDQKLITESEMMDWVRAQLNSTTA